MGEWATWATKREATSGSSTALRSGRNDRLFTREHSRRGALKSSRSEGKKSPKPIVLIRRILVGG